jgi:RNA polymerase sigma-70 factor (ECF subfamily)
LAHSPIPLKPHASDRQAAVVRLTVPFAGDDAALVSAIRAGSPSAKAELFQRYAPQLERLITHVLGYDSELADVLQETFASALRSLGGLKDPNALRPWLFRIATSTAKKTLRSRSRRRWLRYFTDDEDEARHELRFEPPDPDALQAAREVYVILDRLPVDERLAFALRYINGLELMAVAAACDVSLATVKRRLQRAELTFVAAAKDVPTLVDCMESGERWKSR